MTELLTFWVPGTPVTQGSKMYVSKSYIRDQGGQRLDNWRNDIRTEATRVWNWPVIDGAVAVELGFRFPRPKNHFGTGRNVGVLKSTAPEYPEAKRHDIEKLARAVMDALKGVVYVDDGLAVDMTLRKRYAEDGHPGVYITIGAKD